MPLDATELEDLIIGLSTLTTRRTGLGSTAAATLTRLHTAGPLRLTELAALEGVSQPSMSAMVARLVDQGLVRRDGDPRDARVVLLDLTPVGAELVAQRRSDRTARLEGALAELDADDLARIGATLPALTRLADALRRSCSPPPADEVGGAAAAVDSAGAVRA